MRREVIDLEEHFKQEKKQALRNNEYYTIQNTFDKLYADSCKNKKFTKLLKLILDENNILLAYRTIKRNKGSMTAGTDGKTIKNIEKLSNVELINKIKRKLSDYKPKSVRRVEIPKPNGKTRPLGIPCIEDRIIQQCIKQVLEPICEAKFSRHSYGFRPNRATEHAIAECTRYINLSKTHYVVDVDIKGFFDNVNHAKLKKQLWALGIQDKNLIAILGKILKSEIESIGIPEKGTPQGGIISPLLANVCLNELDWWLASQWEEQKLKKDYGVIHKRTGLVNESNKYRAMRTTKLKEFWFVRYADDFKIFCKDYQTAQKIFIATRNWLKERLGLEISPEKSKITNLRKNYTEFLGFKLKVTKNKKKLTCKSKMCDKAKKETIRKLREQIRIIQTKANEKEVLKLNSMILGAHRYYNSATMASRDFNDIHFLLLRTLKSRLKRVMKIKPRNEYSMAYKKLYGNYHGMNRTVAGISIFPIYGCVHEVLKSFPQETCNYTKEGRERLHKRIKSNSAILIYNYLRFGNIYKSVELFDNSVSLIAGQNGLCHISKEELVLGNMELHHKKPRELGGIDEYKNLIWLCKEAHKLVHSTLQETMNKYLEILKLDKDGLKRINTLRKLVGNSEI